MASDENNNNNDYNTNFYCECDAEVYSNVACLTSFSHCDVSLEGIFTLAVWAVLLPCLCGCAALVGCIYCCCQRNRSYYVDEEPMTPYAALPYGQPRAATTTPTTTVRVPGGEPTAVPFSQALGE